MLLNLITKEEGKSFRLLFVLTSDKAIASCRMSYFRLGSLYSSLLTYKDPKEEASEGLTLQVTHHRENQSERSGDV